MTYRTDNLPSNPYELWDGEPLMERMGLYSCCCDPQCPVKIHERDIDDCQCEGCGEYISKDCKEYHEC